jgi:hypothetical protein
MCSEKTNLLRCNWSLVLLAEGVDGVGITTQVLLASNKHHGYLWAEMHDFSDPLYPTTVVSLGGCSSGYRYHTFSCTFSSESGKSTAKQIRTTCESG